MMLQTEHKVSDKYIWKGKFPLVYQLKRILVYQANKENESRHGFWGKNYGARIKIRNKFTSM